MALDEEPLRQTFQSNRDAPRTDPVDIAQQITDWYHNQVFSGNTENQYNNPPANVNKGAFYSALAPAYVDVESSQKSANEGQLDIIASAHEAAAIAYWSGATMARQNLPPGATSWVEHPVTNPGSLSVSFPDINSIGGYVGLIKDAHEAHLLTVQGQLVVNMSDGSVQTFPWVGIS